MTDTEKPPDVLTLAEAEALAERVLEALAGRWFWSLSADRERIASDLAGLRQHYQYPGSGMLCVRCDPSDDAWPCSDARRYSDGLVRTASLYGVSR
jgi:hypothetical protein